MPTLYRRDWENPRGFEDERFRSVKLRGQEDPKCQKFKIGFELDKLQNQEALKCEVSKLRGFGAPKGRKEWVWNKAGHFLTVKT